MRVSDKIFELMKLKGISQKELSDITGIPQSTISDWKRKNANPAADKLMIICDTLGVTPYDILSGTENGRIEKPDYILINKKSEEFVFIQRVRELSSDYKNRLIGYLDALEELNNL